MSGDYSFKRRPTREQKYGEYSSSKWLSINNKGSKVSCTVELESLIELASGSGSLFVWEFTCRAITRSIVNRSKHRNMQNMD